MEIKNYIEEIHTSDAYGVIVETGCGNAVSSALLNVPGASKTIHETYVPYNFDITKQYLKHDCRAVSRATVVDLRNSILDGKLLNYNKFTHKCNLIYTASFQIGDNDPTIISHGYISIKYKGDGAIYHLTFPMGLSREDYIKLISDIGIKLIHCTIKKVFDQTSISNIISDYGETYIDIMEENNIVNKGEEILKNTLFALAGHAKNQSIDRKLYNGNFNQDHFILINKDGVVTRPEDVLRTENIIAFIRGSFNPIHIGHMAQAKYCEDTGYLPVFVLTLNAIDKGYNNAEDLIYRINAINKLGYNVIVCTKPYYVNLHHTILSRNLCTNGCTYSMGTDTIERIAKDYSGIEAEKKQTFVSEFPNTNFFVFQRNHKIDEKYSWILNTAIVNYIKITDEKILNISSTELRKSIDYIKEHIPNEILKTII